MAIEYKRSWQKTLLGSISLAIAAAWFGNALWLNKAEAFTPNVPNGSIDTVSDEIVVDGDQYVDAGGRTINIIVGKLGRQILRNDGIAIGTVISDSGLQDIYSGGLATGTVINDLGVQYVNSGGQAEGTLIYSGGQQSIAANGLATNAKIYDGGRQLIYTNGLAENTQIYLGGEQEIRQNGKSVGTVIMNRGLQLIRDEGLAEQTTVDTGGIQYVYQGGISKDTIINSGGLSIFYTGSIAAGTTQNNGILDLSRYDGATMNISGMGGTVFVYDVLSTTQRELKLQSLSGEQTFIISADLANNQADKISIAGADGTHYIKVLREALDGSELESITGKSATVVQTGSGSATFAGVVSSIDGVKIMPIITQDANNWNLVGYKTVGPSNLTLTDIAGANIAYAAVLSGRDSLKQRLGELRDNPHSYGVWGRIYGGEYALDSSTMKYTTVQGGWDVMRKTSSGRIVSGVLLEHLNSNNSYAIGSGKTTNTLFGVYHAWFGERGHYYDFVFKTGRLYNELTVADEDPIKGDYSINNSTISAEYGYRHQLGSGYYITPQLALNFSWLSGVEYTTNSGTLVREDAVNSIIGKVGATIGRKVNNAELYLSANLLHEFSAKTRVATGKSRMAYTLEQDFQGSTVELSLGGSVNIGKRSLLYLDSSRSFGGKVVNKWTVQAGYRYSW